VIFDLFFSAAREVSEAATPLTPCAALLRCEDSTMNARLLRCLTLCILGSCAMLLAGSGCADRGIKKITLKGTVTYEGKPVTSGLLKIIGPGGNYSAASIQESGHYEITEVVPGELKIGVMETPQGSGSSGGDGGASKVTPLNLPEKFRDPETSGVKYTITEETRELNIELK
jgi:hypothetical protein